MGKTTKDHDLQKNRLLLPANLALKKTPPQSESPPSASRKTVTKSACLSCQKRKTKCSGERPACAKCISFNISCSYETDLANETHAQSRKRKYDELQAMNITYKEIYDFIQNSSRPQAEEVLKRIRSGIGAEPILSQIKGRNLSPHSPPCFQRLLSWRQCRPSLNQEMATDELDQSTILTLPPQPLDAYKTDANEDTWTQIGWTKAHIRHLIDAIFPWDYLPFSLLCYDLFMQSFYSDSAQFCSPALVCAILALASRVVNEDKDDLEILPSGWIGSRTFFKKATAALQEGLSDSLPDIQAVGILSLYHLRCGKEAEAQDCAESFHRRVVELCKHGFSLGDDDEQYLAVRDTTYCGAVSLSRILLLSTGQAFNLSSATLEMHTSIAEKLSILETSNKDVGHAYREYSDKEGGNNGKPRNNMAAFTTVGNQSHLHNLQFVSGLIFQLTEWVYDFITSAPSSTPNVSNTARVFYQKCLDWYEAFFTYAESDFGRTPFVLFTQ
ncbi:hypothetical protein ED733_000559 [Metarhizium rileyi]|uniref:Zn(2)-C6 fungal-type domain-containing protein n=1 Tax=Metarhizium rileyi (strain RCEF 4871) TaxID=1649241 RepID=A0A5C6G2Q4_METRR|nr:hypothetical protein ED733_000559 [Metarhizium rileyi]